MLSLCCVVICVLAQLINSAVHPAAILLRKRRVVDFIDVICRVTEFAQVLQSRGKDGNRDDCISFPVFLVGSLAIALHPLQLDSLFCFSCLAFNSSLLLLTFHFLLCPRPVLRWRNRHLFALVAAQINDGVRL